MNIRRQGLQILLLYKELFFWVATKWLRGSEWRKVKACGSEFFRIRASHLAAKLY